MGQSFFYALVNGFNRRIGRAVPANQLSPFIGIGTDNSDRTERFG